MELIAERTERKADSSQVSESACIQALSDNLSVSAVEAALLSNDLLTPSALGELVFKARNGFPTDTEHLTLKTACLQYLAAGRVYELYDILQSQHALSYYSGDTGIRLPYQEQLAIGLAHLIAITPEQGAVTRYQVRVAFSRSAVEHFRERFDRQKEESPENYHTRVSKELHALLPDDTRQQIPENRFSELGVASLFLSDKAVVVHVFGDLGSLHANGFHTTIFDGRHAASLVVVSEESPNPNATLLHELEHADGKLWWGEENPWTIEERMIDEFCAGVAGGKLPVDRLESIPAYLDQYIQYAREDVFDLSQRILNSASPEALIRKRNFLLSDLESVEARRHEFAKELVKAMVWADSLTATQRLDDDTIASTLLKDLGPQLLIPLLRGSRSFKLFNERADAFVAQLKERVASGATNSAQT